MFSTRVNSGCHKRDQSIRNYRHTNSDTCVLPFVLQPLLRPSCACGVIPDLIKSGGSARTAPLPRHDVPQVQTSSIVSAWQQESWVKTVRDKWLKQSRCAHYLALNNAGHGQSVMCSKPGIATPRSSRILWVSSKKWWCSFFIFLLRCQCHHARW